MEGLTKFKVSQLKNICLVTGLSNSGTKSKLIGAISNGLKRSPVFSRLPNNGSSFNIISIDMGIRNFAYSRVQLDKNLPFNKPLLVKEWTKFDVNHWANVSHDKSFEPIKYSEICHNLVEKVLFDPQQKPPDLIMIERQRARSGGSRSILEWVFRVNMFESMLHATTYSKVKGFTDYYKTDIISSDPKRMSGYWNNKDNKKTKDTKKFRIALIEKWLKETIKGESRISTFYLDSNNFKVSKNTINLLAKTSSKSKWINQMVLSQSNLIEKIYGDSIVDDTKPKGDDLVDSLLHSLAWYEWERNKMILNLEFGMSLENGIKLSEKLLASHEKRMTLTS